MIGLVSSYDLIALDLDGTLLGSDDSISPRNQAAIRDALAAGVRVVFVTEVSTLPRRSRASST
jgi:hydroxymethylpyrimidine pyrophosphatase-like HAD family hydrolase